MKYAELHPFCVLHPPGPKLEGMSMLTLLLLILILFLFAGSFFYRPFGTGYYSYAPSLLFFIIFIIILLYVTGVL